MIQWARQEQRFGCRVACLAMVSGKAYWEVENDLQRCWPGKFNFNESGMDAFASFEWLERQGFVIDWSIPPVANGEVHIVSVRLPSGHWHAVVLLGDGVVLDPECPTPRSIKDYEVMSIARITKKSD